MFTKEVYTVRLDPVKVKKAKDLGIDLPEVIRAALDKVLRESTCPCCKQTIAGKK